MLEKTVTKQNLQNFWMSVFCPASISCYRFSLDEDWVPPISPGVKEHLHPAFKKIHIIWDTASDLFSKVSHVHPRPEYLNPENLSQGYESRFCSVRCLLGSARFHLLSFYEACSWRTLDSFWTLSCLCCSSSHRAHSGLAGPEKRTALGTRDVNVFNWMTLLFFILLLFTHLPK